MQVYPLAQRYMDDPRALEGMWVYDDDFVKAMIRISEDQIIELYVDPFFVDQGIGSKLIKFAIEQMHCDHLWVLEKNVKAQRFYQRHGFVITKEKEYQEGTTEFIVKMRR